MKFLSVAPIPIALTAVVRQNHETNNTRKNTVGTTKKSGRPYMVCQERAPAANGDFFRDAASSGWFKTLEMAYTYVYATAATLASREVDHAAKGQDLHE